MSPEEAVIARLLDVMAVTTLVDDRIYMLKVPQAATFPAIRVQHISAFTDYHLRGGSLAGEDRVQVDAYRAEGSGIDPYADALALAEAIHGDGNGPSASGLSGWIGTTAGSPSLRLMGVFRIDRAVGYDAEELRLVRVRQDYRVFWRES